MKTLRINVKDKIATYFQRDGVIVCGNKGYTIAFTFDEEWDEYTTKTARFIWNGKYYDQQFTDNECLVPVINDTTNVTVGVYAGDLKTTTPAEIPCLISILCGNPEVIEGNIKEYRDIAQQAAEEAQQAAEEAKQAATAVVHPTIEVEEIEGGHRLTINDADGEKTFDVMDGESGATPGESGEDGATFTPSVSSDGVLSWTNDKGLTNPDPVNIKGAPGEDGALTEEQNALLSKLSGWYDEEHYTAMTGTFSMSPTTTTYEIGVSESVKFSWTFSKLPIEVTFNGVTQTAAQSGSSTVTVTSDTHKTLTYSLYGKYKQGETVSKSLSINFRNKYYYGCVAEPTTVDSDFIKSLTKNGWASAKTISFTPNCTEGTYVWYVYPKRLGAATMWMGGFQGGFEEPLTVSVTNDSRFTEDYYVYRSTNSGIGDLSVQAK